ncbi:hypothetical protein [Agreia sp. COWG]|uniref:hypothetical protein n=1 Tax=Agreia sp. COWG TaxID=2773266 RepID=UPI0019254C46|nr:hypothetical protein [Agreia sp. COWG]CAD6003700.1 conserved exported protein of unknown function [Agreia sp. COWG]
MRARLGAAVAMAALLGFGTAGCAFITPQATTKVIEAANGVNGSVGTVDIRNATLISDDGENASLLVTFSNSANESRALTLQYESAEGKTEATVPVKGGGNTSFGGKEDTKIVLRGIDAKAGSLFPVYFQYGDAEGKQLLIPVLTTDFAEYTGLAPTPLPTMTPTPTTPAAPTPTPTPTAATAE